MENSYLLVFSKQVKEPSNKLVHTCTSLDIDEKKALLFIGLSYKVLQCFQIRRWVCFQIRRWSFVLRHVGGCGYASCVFMYEFFEAFGHLSVNTKVNLKKTERWICISQNFGSRDSKWSGTFLCAQVRKRKVDFYEVPGVGKSVKFPFYVLK